METETFYAMEESRIINVIVSALLNPGMLFCQW